MNLHPLSVAIATLAVAGAVFAMPANACGLPDVVSGRLSQNLLAKTKSQATQVAHALHSMERGSSPHARRPGRNIVGMWHFTFTSLGNSEYGIPDGTILDAGYQTWHADGTEITNSSRPPMTQSFCTGVWDHADRDYRLNHYALSWDPTGTQFIGPTNIREMLKVDASGNAISGTFSIDQYSPDGGSIDMHLDGTVSGERITVD